MKPLYRFASTIWALGALVGHVQAADICRDFGPQAPRDITSKGGTNPRLFSLAPPADKLNLCNIHFHTNAEHKGPDYSVFAGKGKHGGYKCTETAKLTDAELKPQKGACQGVAPGDTIEVHWVHTSCAVAPGKGMDACLPKECANPQIRAEAQIFLVVNDASALDFTDFDFAGSAVNGFNQAKALPPGQPVVFRGSKTGPDYTEEKCSPLQVTWSVRPTCAKIDIGSLNKWCAANVFKEDSAYGVRPLVTAPELLGKID